MKKNQRSPKANKIPEEKPIVHSATAKKHIRPSKGQRKISKPFRALDREWIGKQLDEKWSRYGSHFADYSKHGGRAISQILEDVEERILLLFLLGLVSGIHDPEGTNAEDLQNPKGQAVDALCSVTGAVNHFLVPLAKVRNAQAAASIWDNAVELVTAIKELAMTNPETLKPRARMATFMPSFRADVEDFDDDFPTAAKNIELSRSLPQKTGDKAAYHLDSLVTQFVLGLLNEAERARHMLSFMDVFPAKPSRRELLLNQLKIRPEQIRYLDLPPYCKATAKEWWEKCIHPQLHSPRINEVIRGKPLEAFLLKGARKHTDNSVRAKLKDLCRDKILYSLAPECPKTPPYPLV